MKKDNKAKINRIKNRKIWPTVVMFALFLLISWAVVSAVVALFTEYVLLTKVEDIQRQVSEVAFVVDQGLARGNDIEDIITQQLRSNNGDSNPGIGSGNDVYVTDAEGNYVCSVGTEVPDTDEAFDFALEDDEQLLIIFPDEALQGEMGQPLQNMMAFDPVNMFRMTFAMNLENRVGQENWMGEQIFAQSFWSIADIDSDEYQVYVRCNFLIRREEMFYIFAMGAAALMLLLIPITFLFISVISNIKMQRRVMTALYTDPVTGGKNWLWFKENANRTLGLRKNAKKAFMLVSVHMDRYQNFCACYGVSEGEKILESIDGFLKARVQPKEIFAKNSGAAFGILMNCEGERPQEWMDNANQRMRSLLAEMTGIMPDKKINFHAGIYYICPYYVYYTMKPKRFVRRPAMDIDQLYAYADAAAEKSHTSKDGQVHFFNQELLDEQTWVRYVEDHMEIALDNGEFLVYLQPKYSPTDKRLVGAEALVRWNSTDKGIIPPGKFIPIFEENGFITKLDDFMISQVAKLQAEWTLQKRKQVPISVNVSRAHFAQEGLANHICNLVDAFGTKHSLIELEVTESAFFDDKDILVDTVKQLKGMGFGISMDDFGAGYSSLNSLKDIPLDVLKLDGEFFRGEDVDGRGEVVVCEAIQLARNLNMRVVAEGIEKAEQVEFLARQGCDMIQGYYFAKPMPIQEFEERVEADA